MRVKKRGAAGQQCTFVAGKGMRVLTPLKNAVVCSLTDAAYIHIMHGAQGPTSVEQESRNIKKKKL